MNEKQMKALECLNRIEQYAKEQRLATRILDSIDECKNRITVEDPKWNEVNFEVENILKSIESKTSPVTVYVDKDKNEISIQAIKEQISKMAGRCHAENEASIGMMEERKNSVLKKAYSEIQEISYTKAHFKELENEEFYLEFFKKAKGNYESNAFQMIRKMLEDISNNYNHMLEHMKSMFQSIGGYKSGIGNEKFYYEYTEKKEGLDKKIQSEAQSSEIGGSDIVSFGQRTKDAIKDIKKKLSRKTKLLMWAPVLLVLALLLILFSVKTISYINQNRAVIESEVTKDNSEAENGSEEKESSKKLDFVQEIKDVKKYLADMNAEPRIPMKWVLIMVAVIIVLYAVYIISLKLWCNKQIRKRAGEYLKTETIQFEQDNTLLHKLEEVIKNSVEEYEQQYLSVLNQIFLGTNYNINCAENKKADQFTALKEEWNALKYE